MSDHGWHSLLGGKRSSRTRLRGALFTTYDRPDARLLVERLLPDLLRIDASVDGNHREQQTFLGRLATQLEALQTKLVVVSSMPQANEIGAPSYPWLWRHVHLLQVGLNESAVQHAKLWMLHWADEESEQLELVVSSANLTSGAVRDQLQACWRGTFPLESGSDARLRSWGILPSFLEALSDASAGDKHIPYFRELLRRCECPSGVTFLASAPGTHTAAALRRTPWGSAALSQITPNGGATRIRVTAPYIGTWSKEELRTWCEASGSRPNALELLWIDRNHPWARQGESSCWRLPAATLTSLNAIGATLLLLAPDTAFHDDHRGAHDTRWSHAKLYHLRRGRSERLIVTSANLSRSAWGAPSGSGLRIKNFELGVCLDQATWPIAEVDAFADPTQACTVATEPAVAESALSWADGYWDGRDVHLRCRIQGTVRPTVEIRSSRREQTRIAQSWMAEPSGLLMSRTPWTGAHHPPAVALFSVDDEHSEFGVRDLRPPDELKDSPLPGCSKEESDELRERLLLEEYGHYTPEGIALNESSGEVELQITEEGAMAAADYGVALFDQARTEFKVVDEWERRAQLAIRLAQPPSHRQRLRSDGALLVIALRRRAERANTSTLALPSRLCAEELEWRIDAKRAQLEQADA